MKKNYVYFIAPLAGLAIFTGVYWQYSSGFEARMAEMHRKEVEAAQAKLNQDAKNRQAAAESAFKSQEKRKADKKIKDAKDAADKEAREQAQQTMRKAQNDAGKLTSRVKALNKEIDAEKKEIAKLEEEKKGLSAEQAFQRQYVKQAETNVTALLSTLDQVAAADKKWEDAVKEAAKAAAATKK
jgi:predicted  nucleic acid-binding Zn-ribbon protein